MYSCFLLQPNQIGMTWKYTIEWHTITNHGTNPNPQSIVMVTSKPRSKSESQLISIKSWINNENQVLFAQVLRGKNAIIGAKVTATMTLAFGLNETNWNLSKPMPLYDNGFGDPDIVEGNFQCTY